jgi:hypothetical protein
MIAGIEIARKTKTEISPDTIDFDLPDTSTYSRTSYRISTQILETELILAARSSGSPSAVAE